MHLELFPATLAQANDIVDKLHRHHKKVTGHRFSIGCKDENGIVHGCAIVGRPVARLTDQDNIAEVTRLVTDGTPHVCSKLYAACARAAEAMGYISIQTSILNTEPGTSLKAAGWEFDHIIKACSWSRPNINRIRDESLICDKQLWKKKLGGKVNE